jgi:hypothetical protein
MSCFARRNQETITKAPPIPEPQDSEEDKPDKGKQNSHENRTSELASRLTLLGENFRDERRRHPVSWSNLPNLNSRESSLAQQILQRFSGELCDMKRNMPVNPGGAKNLSEPTPAVRAADPDLPAWLQVSAHIQQHLPGIRRMFQDIGKHRNVVN